MSQVLAIVDTVFLITSIFMLILSTIPQFQELKVTLIYINYYIARVYTVYLRFTPTFKIKFLKLRKEN